VFGSFPLIEIGICSITYKKKTAEIIEFKKDTGNEPISLNKKWLPLIDTIRTFSSDDVTIAIIKDILNAA